MSSVGAWQNVIEEFSVLKPIFLVMYSEGVMNQNTDFLNVASHDIDPIAFGLDKSLDLSPVSLLSKDSFSGPFLLFFLVLSDS